MPAVPAWLAAQPYAPRETFYDWKLFASGVKKTIGFAFHDQTAVIGSNMAVELQQLSQVLEASLDPSKNKQGIFTSYDLSQSSSTTLICRPAELAILQEEKKPDFSLSLLQIVASDIFSSTARLASALYFKNYIKRNWTVSTPQRWDFCSQSDVANSPQDEDGNHRLPQNEVVAIKQELIGLMISVPSNIQYQLGDAIGVIADSDFWRKWDTLVDVGRCR